MAVIQGPEVQVLAEIRTALGVASGNVGYLCTHSNINPMAKYKPCRLDKMSALTESDRLSANYGTNIPVVTLDSQYRPITGGAWTHLAPNARYRVLDFNGYQSTKGPCVAFGWGAGIGQVYNINWNTDQTVVFQATIYSSAIPGYQANTVSLKEVLQHANSHNVSSIGPSDLYIWVAVISGTRTFAKRASTSIGAMSTNQPAVINFYPQTDFGGAMTAITDFEVQFFIGGAGTAAATENLGTISYKLSLNNYGGMDRKNFAEIIAPFNYNLSRTTFTPRPTVSYYSSSSSYRTFRTSGSITVKAHRGSLGSYETAQAFNVQVDVTYAGTYTGGALWNGSSWVNTVHLTELDNIRIGSSQDSDTVTFQLPSEIRVTLNPQSQYGQDMVYVTLYAWRYGTSRPSIPTILGQQMTIMFYKDNTVVITNE